MPRLEEDRPLQEKHCLFHLFISFCLLPQSGGKEGGHVHAQRLLPAWAKLIRSHTKFKLRRRQRSRSRGYFYAWDLSCLSLEDRVWSLPTGKAVACQTESASMTKGCRHLSLTGGQNNLSKLAHSNHPVRRGMNEWKKKITVKYKKDDLGCQVGKTG